jgi:serine-type anaerobic sulfatase-maturating enzyme
MQKPREKAMASTDAPPAFHVLAKPTGAICNLNCSYCFYVAKERLYPKSRFRMTDEVLESYIRQYLAAQQVPHTTIAWQGGEPTLMGLDFYRRSIAYEDKYTASGMTIGRTLQTNGTLLDEEWCTFLREHHYLVGLSLDGPRELHDVYRVDMAGHPTFDWVLHAARLLQEHKVDFNILCAVSAANVTHPAEVYRFLRDDVGAQFIQFIPIVERNNETGFQERNTVTNCSVTAEQWGRFLITIFDEWVTRDVGRVFVQHFDAALAAWAGEPPAICIFSPTCGTALALEHNGDLYSCDHFVEPDYRLGNILDTPLIELVSSDAQRQFGLNKRDTLPRYCQECPVRFACHGECPKNRFLETPTGESGLNYLCAGYRAFFTHIDQPMRQMTALLRQGGAPAEVMSKHRRPTVPTKAGRNDPCPCGSGLKYKKCHGAQKRGSKETESSKIQF